MTAFAGIDELTPFLLQPLTESQAPRALVLLDQAAARIRAFTRRTFVREQTTTRFRAVGSQIKLPQTPVISVDSLTLIDYLGNTYPVPVYGFDGIDTLDFAYFKQLVNLPEIMLAFGNEWTGSVDVEYTHGYDVIPEDIVNLNAELVARIFNSPTGGATGVRSQAVGPYSVSVDSTGAAGGIITLTDDDKATLARYRRAQQAVELR